MPAAGYRGKIVAASDEWLVAQGVNYWSGPRSLPLWLPADHTGFMMRSNQRFLSSGAILSSLEQTIDRVLNYELDRGVLRDRGAGLNRPDELALLSKLAVRAALWPRVQ